MKPCWNRLVLCWMLATVLHLPVPVVGGGDLCPFGPSCQGQGVGVPETLLQRLRVIDIDYILVGCPVPDDVDHGPIDTEPQNDVQWLGSFPLFVKGNVAKHLDPLNHICQFLDAVPYSRQIECPDSITIDHQWTGDTAPRASRTPVLRC